MNNRKERLQTNGFRPSSHRASIDCVVVALAEIRTTIVHFLRYIKHLPYWARADSPNLGAQITIDLIGFLECLPPFLGRCSLTTLPYCCFTCCSPELVAVCFASAADIHRLGPRAEDISSSYLSSARCYLAELRCENDQNDDDGGMLARFFFSRKLSARRQEKRRFGEESLAC